ncbi:conserved hypothetical protein [Methanococcus vannielii SB]|uniref:Acyl carrier protein phosphodiesterase n=1 Tax=Methanococcus vannielii (strain ATCC 35089 / DSM 1224 / JCM 13029 / OCM 148 / SB) TaxID=406327 RepID=A6UR94_METVS|nr:zinc dependent phospholipase C family protein [Methanococcus vannielii]ABR55016.1 conserved hypothetical protein [Methanococcus vannielii SB]
MPNFYSHLVLSKIILEKDFKSNFDSMDLNNFYFGSVSPDIGYFSKIERKITHFYEKNPENFFGKDSIFEISFLKGYNLHLHFDNVWKYEIRLKNEISIEENSKIYAYLDEFLKSMFKLDFDYFLPHVIGGNCDFLKKLGIEKEICERWKKKSIYKISEFKTNENYQKVVDEYLKLLKVD